MSISYSNACSQTIFRSTCSVCLDMFEDSNSADNDNTGRNIIGLPQCNHLIHQGCFNHWTSHLRELARRDVSIEVQATCPLCKVKVEENEAFNDVNYNVYFSNYDNPDPDPELPLTRSETPDPDGHYDTQSLQALFDQAVSIECLGHSFNVSNFPALHQMKNRYGITLSAEQLDKILDQALLTNLYNSNHMRIDTSAANKIKMAMLLRSDDEASKGVVNDSLRKILSVDGYCRDVTIDFLLGQEISDKEVLQAVFEYYIKKKSSEKAEEMHEKHDLRIGREMLKQELMRVGSNQGYKFLSKIADSSQNFQLAALEALKALNETQIDFNRRYFAHIKDAINVLLGTSISDQSEVSKSLRLAVLADDKSWQDMLQRNYGAVLEPQFLKEQLEGTADSDLIRKILSLYNLRANDEESTAALITALMRVVTAKHDHCRYSRVENLLTTCLRAQIWDQQLVNKALTLAIDMDSYTWAETLNNKFQAVLEPQILEDYLWKPLASYILTRRSSLGAKTIVDVKRILSFANKENVQSNKVVSSVLKRLQEDTNSYQIPVIQRCVDLLTAFNDASTSSPEPKRKKIA